MSDPDLSSVFVRMVGCLSAHRFDATDEKTFQDGVFAALRSFDLEVEAEVELRKGDIIDFMVGGGIGLELKIKGSQNAVLRQLMRYAESPRVVRLALFTTQSSHFDMPSTIRGKPLLVYLRGGLA